LAKPPRLILVSYLASDALSPRGIRTRALAEGLSGDWQVEVIGGPTSPNGTVGGDHRESVLDRAISRASRSLLMDRREIWSKRRFAFWNPEADLALLIGYPFSPIADAARRLTRKGIPYVVDVGDPWVLTAGDPPPHRRHTALVRSRRAERRLWENAVGAIVTTTGQAEALAPVLPAIPVLVRPNGYQEISRPREPRLRRPVSGQPLRLVHFGAMYRPRVDITRLLLDLAQSDCWPSVVFDQYGADPEGVLQRLPSEVEVHVHSPVPWTKAVSASLDSDVALAIGNRNPNLLPSKVIEYLTLPIPRVAVVGNDGPQAIRDYVRDKPGWLVISSDESNADLKLAAHRSQEWPAERLAPPESESWPCVADQVRGFLEHCQGAAAIEAQA
jgi:glycosyltransferase involved in cell wall biosynthesis